MRRLLVLTLAMASGGCEAIPLPEDKAEYAGHWKGPDVDLVIEPSGQVQFKKLQGKGQVQISGPITQWIDEDFVVGVMVMKTKFDVSEPPHLAGEAWVMTVDGVELLRQP
ncbi:MAG: hypothetical protein AAF721_09270 [Myxococcota bacterium]